MKKKLLIGVVILSMLIGGGFLIKKKITANSMAKEAKFVRVAKAKLGEITTTIIADGKVKAAEDELFKARIDGVVKKILVEEGDKVRVNDKIVEFYDEELQKDLQVARIDLAEVNKNYTDKLEEYQEQDQINKLKLAEKKYALEVARKSLAEKKIELNSKKEELERDLKEVKDELEDSEYLYQKNAITKKKLKKVREEYSELEDELTTLLEQAIPIALQKAELQVQQAQNKLKLFKASSKRSGVTTKDLEVSKLKIERAKAEIESIESKLEKRLVTSSIPGTIVELRVKEGDKITEGSSLGKVASVNNLIIEAMVDEIDINQVAVGQEVMITSEAVAREIKGQVTKIAPIATQDGNINKFKTEIELEDVKGLLKPGMFVSCEVITNSKTDVVTISPLALLGEEEKYVYLAKQGVVEKRKVKVGLKTLNKVEVTGVKEGEKVIIGPFTILKNLKSGAAVKMQGKR